MGRASYLYLLHIELVFLEVIEAIVMIFLWIFTVQPP
jgi:hypothetical protein